MPTGWPASEGQFTVKQPDGITQVEVVRLNFVEKSRASGPYGRTFAVDVLLHDEKIYANALNLVGDAIFIRSKTK